MEGDTQSVCIAFAYRRHITHKEVDNAMRRIAVYPKLALKTWYFAPQTSLLPTEMTDVNALKSVH